jgi:hypothetical protein
MIGDTMTAPRQRRKPVLLLAVVAAAAATGGFGGPGAPLAATTELVVVDRHTGLAISGFDPVAYFTDGAPVLGKAEFECSFAGAEIPQ